MAVDLQLAWPWAAVACGLEHVGEPGDAVGHAEDVGWMAEKKRNHDR